MDKNVKLLIKGHLDFNATKDAINKQIQALQSKIDKLKLTIHLDEKISKTLSDFSRSMEHHKKIAQDLNRVVKEEKTITKEADGVIKEKTRQHLKSGEIIEKEVKRINEKTKATQNETGAIEKQNKAIQRQGELQKQRFQQDTQGNKKLTSETYKDGFNTITTNTQTGIAKVVHNVDQERTATEQLKVSKDKLRQSIQQLNSEGKITAETFGKLNRAIDNSRNIQQVQKLEQNLNNLKRIQENQHKIDMARQQAQINVQGLRNTHGGFIDNQAMNQYLNSVNQLNPRMTNLTQNLQQSNMQWRQLAQNTRSAAGASQQAGMSFAEMFSTAMTKFPIWMISATMFYAPIRALSDMSERLVTIDSLMVNIKRVMDIPDFKFTELLQEAVNVSDELSSKLVDVLSILGDFARMSFKENELIDISKTAQVLQNISDLNATESVDTLTSAMLNYNIAAKDSLMIADKLNEVDL